MKIKIALLDDHQIVIDGLKLLLSTNNTVEIVAESNNAAQFLELLPSLAIDILITDVMMPEINGVDVAIHIKNTLPHIKVIALSMNGEGKYLSKLINEGEIKGYILKSANTKEISEAIQTVANGGEYFTKEIESEMQLFNAHKRQQEAMHLTARELEIIKHICQGNTNKQIADQLFISERTVETHRKNIFKKTNVHNIAGLIAFAKQEDIL